MHSWNLTPKEAVKLQNRLRRLIRTDLTLTDPERIAGVDVAYIPSTGESVATVVMLSYPELRTVESAVAKMETPFPYVPGLLSFREIPAILRALEGLSGCPDLIFVDGHGRAHPRRIGIASHLGLWLKLPTIGVGKSRLCGEYREPGRRRRSCTRLTHAGEVIGRVVRTREGVKPIFVSVGYGLPLEDCVRWTLSATQSYRLPEPIRRADLLSKRSKLN